MQPSGEFASSATELPQGERGGWGGIACKDGGAATTHRHSLRVAIRLFVVLGGGAVSLPRLF